MYANITPIRKLPRNIHTFTYKIPSDLVAILRIGSLVNIPFRKSTIGGIIQNIQSTTDISAEKIKEIPKDALSDIQLTEKQILFAKWVSDYYMTPFSLIINSFLPEKPKSNTKKETKSHSASEFVSLKEIKALADIFIQNTPTPSLFKYNTEHQKLSFYRTLFENCKQNTKSQILIIVPEIGNIANIVNIIPTEMKHCVFRANLGKSANYKAWMNIAKSEISVIIGTKISLFLPFASLKYIIVDDEQSDSHKQWDSNPRISSRTCAFELAKIYSSKIILATSAPQMESFYNLTEKKLTLYNAPVSLEQPSISIAYLQDEFKKKNYSFLSETLQNAIKENHKNKKQTILILNKKGFSSKLFCADCGYVDTCNVCKGSLAIKETTTFCILCKKNQIKNSVCLNCSGYNLKETGIGIDKIYNTVCKQFPEIPTLLFDEQVLLKKSLKNMLEYSVIIGTESLNTRYQWHNVATVALVLSDIDLSIPDFRATEKHLQTLIKIKTKLGYESCKNTQCIIQTFSPNHPVYNAFLTNNLTPWLRKELRLREEYDYPPYAKFIKIMYYDKNSTQPKTIFDEISLKLNVFYNALQQVRVIPIGKSTKDMGGKTRWVVLLKYKDRKHLQEKTLQKIIPNDWIIDIDPIDFT